MGVEYDAHVLTKGVFALLIGRMSLTDRSRQPYRSGREFFLRRRTLLTAHLLRDDEANA
jgi:hypothetical protein